MRIGLLAAQAGITAKTIRFYEDTGLMPAPARTSAGYRDYPAGAAARLAFIRDAQAAGLSLAEIRSILVIRDDGQPPCQHVTDLIDQHLAQVSQRLAELAQARDALRALKSRASATDPGNCPQDQVCSILTMTPRGNPGGRE